MTKVPSSSRSPIGFMSSNAKLYCHDWYNHYPCNGRPLYNHLPRRNGICRWFVGDGSKEMDLADNTLFLMRVLGDWVWPLVCSATTYASPDRNFPTIRPIRVAFYVSQGPCIAIYSLAAASHHVRRKGHSVAKVIWLLPCWVKT